MTRLAIDTDPGIDDALALLLAFGAPGASVEVVTTVAGNVELPLATANAHRILAVAAPGEEPCIVPGAAAPLARRLVTAAHYHGADGLGGVGTVTPATALPCAAPDAIIGAARTLGGMLTLVAIGPLTNVAIALGRDPEALRGIGRLVVMAGAVDVPGNVTAEAEFNAHADPEAVERVLSAGLPVDVVPLDVTRHVVLRPEALAEALEGAPRPIAELVSGITRQAFSREGALGGPGIELHDPLAVGVALEPSFVRLEPLRLRVGPEGETRRAAGWPNCRVAVDVDAGRFIPWFLARLCRRASS
jgi:inosine-uridine nucleoside N-ribohydrolase